MQGPNSRRLGWAALLASVALTALGAMAALPPVTRVPQANLNKTIETQRRLTTEQPQDAAAWNDLGNLYVLAGRMNDAEGAYRKAVEIEPGQQSALFNRRMRDQEEGRKRIAHPPPPTPQYDPGQGIVFGDKIPEAAAEALYRGMVAAGEGPRFDVATFQSYLGKQVDAIRQKTGCEQVQFRIAVEEGKMKLKARPLVTPKG